jgi:hypothetical protein
VTGRAGKRGRARRSPPGHARTGRRRSPQWVGPLALGVGLGGAVYLLLIDTLDSPELYAGAAAALLAGIAFAAAIEHDPQLSISPAWMLHGWRALASVPGDIARVSGAALAQLASPRRSRGVLRAIPFEHGTTQAPRDAGRRALVEALGSLAPNTIVVGIDPERELLLVHQLERHGGAEAIDVLGLR